MQKLGELTELLQLLSSRSWRTVVEVGTGAGGTLYAWCQIAAPDAAVVSIDLRGGPFGGGYEDGDVATLLSYGQPGQAVHLLRGDSGRRATLERLERLLQGRPIELLILDGDHSYYGVRTDFVNLAPLVGRGGLIALHDVTDDHWDPAVEVPLLWRQLKRRFETEEIVHPNPEQRWGGFGLVEWGGGEEAFCLDLLPYGDELAAAGAPLQEPVVQVDTAVGPLLLPESDRMITAVLVDCGTWEPDETSYLRRVLRPGDTFVDVGAHVGYFSVLAAACVGPSGRVVAVEPELRNLKLLQRNLALNGSHQAEILPFAAHCDRGWMSLQLDEENRGGHRLAPLKKDLPLVRCVRLDDVLEGRVDVVKVDVQGFDLEAVQGLERTIAANPSMTILVELSPLELSLRQVAVEEVLASYEQQGFAVWLLDNLGFPYRPTVAELESTFSSPDCRDRNLLLTRRASGRPRPTARPCRALGLEVNETTTGLSVRQLSRSRDHDLNSTAAVVFELCTGKQSLSQIAAQLAELYGFDEPPLGEAERCLAHLEGEGLIYWASPEREPRSAAQ